jgi:hypothetical protein
VNRRNGNTGMAKPRQGADGIVVLVVGAAILLRKKSKGMAKPYAKKRSKCTSMEQA